MRVYVFLVTVATISDYKTEQIRITGAESLADAFKKVVDTHNLQGSLRKVELFDTFRE